MRRGHAALLCCTALLLAAPRVGAEVYEAPEAFVAEVFGGAPPPPRVLWVDASLREQAREVLGHELGALRVRYWREQGRSAFVLDEIGKELPITTGIAVANGQIAKLRVLVFRESRGWEVRYPFFTDQFNAASLGADLELDRRIDGISGATLSAQALERLARLALLLDQAITVKQAAR